MEYVGQHGTYRVLRALNTGGMAHVFTGLALDSPDHVVAIKVPRPDIDEAAKQLFLHEAKAAARVRGEGVVTVLDWGETPSDFIVFEYIEAPTLDAEISRRRNENAPWTNDELRTVFRQFVNAMALINAEVLHRDLKPANVFLTESGPKVSDFGIAKYVGKVTRSRTFKGWGTPAYQSPESLTGQSGDHRSDQYALGIIFYEMTLLRRPFDSEDDDALVSMQLYERAERPSRVSDRVSPQLSGVIMRMLEKQQERRFPNWEAVAAALDAVVLSATPAGDDPLAAAAAAGLDEARNRELATMRERDLLHVEKERRAQLVSYWADDLFGVFTSRADKLNRDVGEDAIQYRRAGEQDVRSLRAMFLRGRLVVELCTVPADEEVDFILWGKIELTTPRRYWYGNVILLPAPAPYGSWQEVTLRPSPLMRDPQAMGEEDAAGGQYRVVAHDLGIAMNWKALAYQRAIRGAMSTTVYEEKPLDIDAVTEEILGLIVEDGALPSESQ